jgi:thiosulfate/3-mercaptopyruvate sulfurtransferase
MAEGIFPLIEPEALVNIHQSENFILIDARTGIDAHTKYLHTHLKAASFVSLETQLADIKMNVANGGRHPLPDPQKFAKLVGGLGIDTNSHVVVYDDKNGANAAARFWWMLRSIGHNKIQVLNGGYDAAIRAGFPTSSGEESVLKKDSYNAHEWLLPTITIEEVEKAAGDNSFKVIDVREKMRYDGEHEPIDLIAGHIPGAINIPFTNNLDEKGLFLSSSELRDKYIKALQGINPENVIVHCGSGVTACHTILAMYSAGLTIPVLYTGSWSEWSRNNMPMATAYEK